MRVQITEEIPVQDTDNPGNDRKAGLKTGDAGCDPPKTEATTNEMCSDATIDNGQKAMIQVEITIHRLGCAYRTGVMLMTEIKGIINVGRTTSGPGDAIIR